MNAITLFICDSVLLFRYDFSEVSYIDRIRKFIPVVDTKIFTIVAPAILYGMAADVVYGIVYWVTTLV